MPFRGEICLVRDQVFRTGASGHHQHRREALEFAGGRAGIPEPVVRI